MGREGKGKERCGQERRKVICTEGEEMERVKEDLIRIKDTKTSDCKDFQLNV